ncbi:MAG: DUF2933 domain-containing protein [Actinobacteria bacterium]|nr:DUF2933 domain-containing protein [Actinomycetota bacterium]
MTKTETTDKGTCSSPPVGGSNGFRIGGMCLNWKVLAGLVALGLGIWAIAPNLIVAAAPLLLFAACPLSMWLMMRAMSGGQHKTATEPPGATAAAEEATETARPRDLAALKAQHARLTAELETLEGDVREAKIGPSGSPKSS